MECRELLDGITYTSLERAARHLRSSYQERYAHLLSELKWTREELQELGYSLRSTIELSQRVHLEIKDRVDRCERAGYLGPDISEELRDELEYEVRQHIASLESSDNKIEGAGESGACLYPASPDMAENAAAEPGSEEPSFDQDPARVPESAAAPLDELANEILLETSGLQVSEDPDTRDDETELQFYPDDGGERADTESLEVHDEGAHVDQQAACSLPSSVGSSHPVGPEQHPLPEKGLDLTLAELVERRSFVSVRLANCARHGSVFRLTKVGDFLEDPDAVRAALYRVRSMGRKTVTELERLITSYAEAVETARLQSATSDRNPSLIRQLGITLLDLVNRSESASVRLVNCAKHGEIFQSATVRDYLGETALIQEQLHRVPAMGRTTISELDRLVRSYAQAVLAGDVPEVEPSDDEIQSTPVIPERIAVMTVGDLVSVEAVSARLFNCVTSDAEAAAIPLRMAVEDRQGFVRRLLGIWSLGRKSIDELLDVVDRTISRMPFAAGADDGADISDGMQEIALLMEQEAEGTLAHKALENVLATGLNPDVLQKSSREAVREALDALPERQRSVLEHRFGLDGRYPQTLGQIAQLVYVTRERVRQVESKALKTLRLPGSLWAFQRLVHEEQAEAWDTMTGGHPILTPSLKRANLPLLDALFLLAVTVVHDGLDEWISSYATGTTGGWAGPANDIEAMRRNRKAVVEALEGLMLPRSLDPVAAATGLTPCDIESALKLSKDMHIYCGYVHAGFLGAQAKRTIKLHRLAASVPGRLFDVQTLAKLYRDAHPEDQVSSRMVLMQMSEAPHLFGQLFDSIWFALPASPGDRVQVIPYELDASEDDGGFDEGLLGEWLVGCLRHEGPSRLTDIRDRMAASALGSKYSRTSVRAILGSHACFRKVAPGVHDVYSGTAGTRDERLVPLLSERQCRFYAYSRFGGDPPNYFPFWDGSLEWRLCVWARANASTETFRSLLHVAEPASWPADEHVRLEWARLKKIYGSWELSLTRRVVLGSRFPKPDELYAALVHLVCFGAISWFSVNRTSQNKLDNHDAADTLALLAAVGAVRAPAHWQMPHHASPRAKELLQQMELERCRSGSLSWSEGVLSALLPGTGATAAENTWIPAAELSAMLRVQQDSHGTQPERAGSELKELDEIFESDDWNSLFKENAGSD